MRYQVFHELNGASSVVYDSENGDPASISDAQRKAGDIFFARKEGILHVKVDGVVKKTYGGAKVATKRKSAKKKSKTGVSSPSSQGSSQGEATKTPRAAGRPSFGGVTPGLVLKKQKATTSTARYVLRSVGLHDTAEIVFMEESLLEGRTVVLGRRCGDALDDDESDMRFDLGISEDNVGVSRRQLLVTKQSSGLVVTTPAKARNASGVVRRANGLRLLVHPGQSISLHEGDQLVLDVNRVKDENLFVYRLEVVADYRETIVREVSPGAQTLLGAGSPERRNQDIILIDQEEEDEQLNKKRKAAIVIDDDDDDEEAVLPLATEKKEVVISPVKPVVVVAVPSPAKKAPVAPSPLKKQKAAASPLAKKAPVVVAAPSPAKKQAPVAAAALPVKKTPPAASKEQWVKGDLVDVARRMGKGSNKPGGAARVWSWDGEAETVFVKYIMGGSEKAVPLAFVTRSRQQAVEPPRETKPAVTAAATKKRGRGSSSSAAYVEDGTSTRLAHSLGCHSARDDAADKAQRCDMSTRIGSALQACVHDGADNSLVKAIFRERLEARGERPRQRLMEEAWTSLRRPTALDPRQVEALSEIIRSGLAKHCPSKSTSNEPWLPGAPYAGAVKISKEAEKRLAKARLVEKNSAWGDDSDEELGDDTSDDPATRLARTFRELVRSLKRAATESALGLLGGASASLAVFSEAILDATRSSDDPWSTPFATAVDEGRLSDDIADAWITLSTNSQEDVLDEQVSLRKARIGAARDSLRAAMRLLNSLQKDGRVLGSRMAERADSGEVPQAALLDMAMCLYDDDAQPARAAALETFATNGYPELEAAASRANQLAFGTSSFGSSKKKQKTSSAASPSALDAIVLKIASIAASS